MRQFLVAAFAAVLFSLASVVDAGAQGVWQLLEQAGKAEPRSSQMEYRGKSSQQICSEAESVAGSLKCRGSYLSGGFAVHWRGQDTRMSHGPIVEVLVRGDDAVACFNDSYDMTETSPCLPLRRVN